MNIPSDIGSSPIGSPHINKFFIQEQEDEMYVIKRNGTTEIVSFNKILKRIKTFGSEQNIKINYTQLAMKVIDQLFNNITTTQIDILTARLNS